MARGNCKFTGTGGQYFTAVFVRLFLLTMLTVGFYGPWAWVRIYRLRASHTVVHGKRVAFIGTGGSVVCVGCNARHVDPDYLGRIRSVGVVPFFCLAGTEYVGRQQAQLLCGEGRRPLRFPLAPWVAPSSHYAGSLVHICSVSALCMEGGANPVRWPTNLLRPGVLGVREGPIGRWFSQYGDVEFLCAVGHVHVVPLADVPPRRG